MAERGGVLPLVKGKANFSLRGVCALLRVARRANPLNEATQKAPYIKGALAWRREGDFRSVTTIPAKQYTVLFFRLTANTQTSCVMIYHCFCNG